MSKLLDWLFQKPDQPDEVDVVDRTQTDETLEAARAARRRLSDTATAFRQEAEAERNYQSRLREVLSNPGLDYDTLNHASFGRLPKHARKRRST